MSWNLTSRRKAWHRLVTANPPAWVLDHCAHVEALAVAMAQTVPPEAVDLETVSTGALLHDVGRSIAQDITHASLGADLLEAEAWPPKVVDVVRCHTGAGILPSEVEELGLPAGRYVPASLEERIVAHADNLYSGSKRLGLDDVVDKYRGRGLGDAARRIQSLHDGLEAELGIELDELQPARLDALT